jgi:hypothetical protein
MIWLFLILRGPVHELKIMFLLKASFHLEEKARLYCESAHLLAILRII